MNRAKKTNQIRIRRARRVRHRIRGTALKPRLSVFRSGAHIYAQLIDDVSQKTLVAASSLNLRGKALKKIEIARAVGDVIGKKALEGGIKVVIFDRGRYRYHGRVRAVAEGVREAGLKM